MACLASIIFLASPSRTSLDSPKEANSDFVDLGSISQSWFIFKSYHVFTLTFWGLHFLAHTLNHYSLHRFKGISLLLGGDKLLSWRMVYRVLLWKLCWGVTMLSRWVLLYPISTLIYPFGCLESNINHLTNIYPKMMPIYFRWDLKEWEWSSDLLFGCCVADWVELTYCFLADLHEVQP